jgi:hypothetical protein
VQLKELLAGALETVQTAIVLVGVERGESALRTELTLDLELEDIPQEEPKACIKAQRPENSHLGKGLL